MKKKKRKREDKCGVAALYCTVLYCTALHCTALYCTTLYCAVLYYTALCCAVLYCTVLYYTVLYCTVLYCTVLYCSCNIFNFQNSSLFYLPFPHLFSLSLLLSLSTLSLSFLHSRYLIEYFFFSHSLLFFPLSHSSLHLSMCV
jgi:hypothetical protein